MSNEMTDTRVSDSGVSQQMSVSDVAAKQIGRSNVPIETSIDTTDVRGKDQLSRHLEYQGDANQKVSEGWYGKEFLLVAYTARVVVATKSPDGEVYETPKQLVRTVMESEDGKMLASSSAYLYDSLKQIESFCGMPSITNAIPVKLGKGGAADRLFRVYDTAPDTSLVSKKRVKESTKE